MYEAHMQLAWKITARTLICQRRVSFLYPGPWFRVCEEIFKRFFCNIARTMLLNYRNLQSIKDNRIAEKSQQGEVSAVGPWILMKFGLSILKQM